MTSAQLTDSVNQDYTAILQQLFLAVVINSSSAVHCFKLAMLIPRKFESQDSNRTFWSQMTLKLC